MKRNLMALILALCLLGTSLAGAEGLLPSLTDTIGKPMPSLGEALGRYPDEEIPEADGGNTEVFQGVTETDFNTFSVYLSEKGATLADYQAAGSSFSASIQVEGKTIGFTYDTKSLEAAVTYPRGTYDKWLDYAKIQYKSAIQMFDDGNIVEGLTLLYTIPNYIGFKPAADYLETHPKLVEEAKLAPYRKVGSYVSFGHYEQDNDLNNGQEAIEWLVLDYDKKNNRTLLISRYGLDRKMYHTQWTAITWEKCTLRSWLNNDFYNMAFSTKERSAIIMTNVDNSLSQGFDFTTVDSYAEKTTGGNNTKDKIFLLSYAEANKYLGVATHYYNIKSRVSPTAYAVAQGAVSYDDDKTEDGTAAAHWWLRSPGDEQRNAAFVGAGGMLLSLLVKNNFCVRPALWINLDSDIF